VSLEPAKLIRTCLEPKRTGHLIRRCVAVASHACSPAIGAQDGGQQRASSCRLQGSSLKERGRVYLWDWTSFDRLLLIPGSVRLPDQAAPSFTVPLRQAGGGGLSPPLGSWRLVALGGAGPGSPRPWPGRSCSRSIANPLATARYASRSSTARHPRRSADGDAVSRAARSVQLP
jgi:hypothetical protein